MLQLLSICQSSQSGVRVEALQIGCNKRSWTVLGRCIKQTTFTSPISWWSCMKQIKSDFSTRLGLKTSKTTLQRPALDKLHKKSCKCWLTSSWVSSSRTNNRLCILFPTNPFKVIRAVWVNYGKILHLHVSWFRVPTKKPSQKLKDSSDTLNHFTQS